MTRVKVEFLTNEGRALDTGDTWRGFPVDVAFPGDPNVLIRFPDDWDRTRITAFMNQPDVLAELVPPPAPNVPPWRFEHLNYVPAVLPPDYRTMADPNFVSGDTFGLHASDLAEIRRLGKGGAGVGIVTADTGIDNNHSHFTNYQIKGSGFARDSHGHGTHVASTAGGHFGVAPQAGIYSTLALPLQGGSGTEGDIANSIREGVDLVLADNLKCVVSLSVGGPTSSIERAALTYAHNKGAVTVAAAGNSGGQPRPGSPADGTRLIAMAHNRTDQWASFTDGLNWPDYKNRVGANGVQVRAAAANTGSGEVEMSGTSMSCPTVAGFVALLMGAGMTADQAVAYMLAVAHVKAPPTSPGKLWLLADFGAITPPPVDHPPTTITKSMYNERQDMQAVQHALMTHRRTFADPLNKNRIRFRDNTGTGDFGYIDINRVDWSDPIA